MKSQLKFFVAIAILLLFNNSHAQDSKTNAESYFKDGQSAASAKNWQTAIDNYKRSLELEDKAIVRYNMAVAYFMFKDNESATKNFDVFLASTDERASSLHKDEANKYLAELKFKESYFWIYQVLTKLRTPGMVSYYEHAKESKEDAKDRYESIALDLAKVVYNPNSKPIFNGKYGRARTAMLMISVAFFESGFRRDIDYGLGKFARGDKGKSWCLMQMHIGNGKTPEGWSGQDLVQDRTKCFTAGLNAMRRSFSACRKQDTLDRLSAYATGSCKDNQTESRSRVGFAVTLISRYKVSILDKNAQAILFKQKPEQIVENNQKYASTIQ